MPHRMKSILLVALQFLFLGLLLWGTPVNKLSVLPAILLIISLCLMLTAVVAMQKSKWRVFPEPSANATLITHGPYRYIRHPMYTAIILFTAGLLINYFTWLRLIMVISLVIVLISKLTWEEKLLRQNLKGIHLTAGIRKD